MLNFINKSLFSTELWTKIQADSLKQSEINKVFSIFRSELWVRSEIYKATYDYLWNPLKLHEDFILSLSLHSFLCLEMPTRALCVECWRRSTPSSDRTPDVMDKKRRRRSDTDREEEKSNKWKSRYPRGMFLLPRSRSVRGIVNPHRRAVSVFPDGPHSQSLSQPPRGLQDRLPLFIWTGRVYHASSSWSSTVTTF